MPYPTKTLSQLRTEVAQDIQALLGGTDPLLRFSNLQVMGAAQAGMVRELYGFLSYIALQAVPYTASGEWLEAWAATKGVYRIAAAQAIGTVSFAGSPNGTVLPAGTKMVRGDGKGFTSTADATVTAGFALASVQADADPAGLLGAFGNTDPGQLMNLSTSVSGISGTGTVASAFTGGADLEGDDSLRQRMLLAFQSEEHGGDAADYVLWARAVAGVTRAWCVPHGMGPGTVLLYTMFDVSEAAHGGFPQGTDGVATAEPRDTVATGDQLAVANAIFPVQPVTALVYSYAPGQDVVAYTLAGTTGWSVGTKAAVSDAIDAVHLAHGSIDSAGGTTTVLLTDINAAITAVPGTGGYTLTTPSANLTVPFGQLPVRGTTTFNP